MGTPSEAGARGYIALIGDVKRSRHVTERAQLQRLLESGIGAANVRFAQDVVADFVLTLGDEFQGVLVRPGSVVEVLVALDGALGGTAVRYGVGWGELSTDLKEVALRMDGPCFHNARDALMTGKRDDRWATVAGFGSDDEVLNGLLWLIGSVRWQWTDIQRQTVDMIRTAETQRVVAEERGVSINAVSKALKSALYEPMLAAERAATQILERYDELCLEAGDAPEVTR